MYLDSLFKCNLTHVTPKRLQKVLDNLPTDIYSTYDQIIRKIEDSDIRSELFAALRLMLYAAGPPYIEDLVEVCATLSGGNEDQLFDDELRLSYDDVAQHLSGLLRFMPPIPPNSSSTLSKQIIRVTFDHFSVAEYLHNMKPGE